MSDLEPLQPTLTGELFAPLGRELCDLLRSLSADDWARPTVCSEWAVRDVAAHLLDSACRRLSVERDDHELPGPESPIESYGDLVAFLNDLNATWVRASQRLSPRVLADLIETIEKDLATVLKDLDPHGTARFPVAWAGEDGSQAWFDIARELTERWLHQQQIRLAVEAPPLTEPTLSRPVFDTFLRALPHHYRTVEAEESVSVQIEITGAETYQYALVLRGEAWELRRGTVSETDTTVSLSEETAWLSLTKGITPEVGADRSVVEGREELWRPFFDAVAVMA